ncbi:MAG: hypothetical protein Ta2B_01620 [Termitinemataceae bacterium]|nr:MAG: hypothetical protein Ta2B_01620 [Termitinemataceae bacterium]
MFDFGDNENEQQAEKETHKRSGGTREQRLRVVKDNYAAGKIDFNTTVEKYMSIYPKLFKEIAEKTVKTVFEPPKESEKKNNTSVDIAAAQKIKEPDFDILDNIVSPLDMGAEENIIPLFEEFTKSNKQVSPASSTAIYPLIFDTPR